MAKKKIKEEMMSEDFVRNNFLMRDYYSNKITTDWRDYPKEDYFDEMDFALVFTIPKAEGELGNQELVFSYRFQFYHQENGSCEVVFNDINRPTLTIDYSTMENFKDELGEIKKNDSYAECHISDKPFLDFVAETTIKYLSEEFSKIDEQYFFYGKVNKKKVDLNKNLLSDLRRNFQREIISTVNYLKEGDEDSILKLHDNIPKKSLSELINNIKISDTKFNYAQLNKELNSEENKTIRKKPKI